MKSSLNWIITIAKQVVTFILHAFKAFIPLLVYGVSEAANRGFDLNTPTGLKNFLWSVAAAIIVYWAPNKAKEVK